MAGVPAGRLSIEIVAEIARLQQDLDKAKRAVGAASKDMAGSAKYANDNIAKMGPTSKLAGHHLSNLSFQLQDVVIGLQSGQKPMTVFLQQGGQIAQIMGQAGIGVGGLVKQVGMMAFNFAKAHPIILGITAALGVGAMAFRRFTDQLEETGELQKFVDGLGLSKEELEELGPVTITAGDAIKGLWKTIDEGLGLSGIFSSIGKWASEAFSTMLTWGKNAAAGVYAAFVGTYNGLKATWSMLPSVFGDAVYSAANAVIDGLNWLIRQATALLNLHIIALNALPFTDIALVTAPQIAKLENQYAGAGAKAGQAFIGAYREAYGDALAGMDRFGTRLADNILDAAKDRISARADEIIDDRTAEKVGTKAGKKIGEAAAMSFREAFKDFADYMDRILEASRDTAKMREQLEALEREATLLGVTGHERERRILLMDYEIDRAAKIAALNVALASGEQQIADELQKQLETLEKIYGLDLLKINFAADAQAAIAEQEAFLEMLDIMAWRADRAAQGMSEAFGRVGEALGELNAEFARYAADKAKAEDEMAKAERDHGKQSRQYENARLAAMDLQIDHYRELAGTAKHFFKEGSTGYKVLGAAEKAFALIQLANTAINVAAGAAKMFAMLGPWAFPAVAAMVAVMAGLGFRSGSGSAQVQTAEQVQAAQGTGTVLGDPTGKSESIARALELTAANTNEMLEYDNAMLRSLRSIDDNIGVLTTQIARELSIGGGAFDPSALGIGTSTKGLFDYLKFPGLIGFIALQIPIIGDILKGIGKLIFNVKKTVTLVDQGVQFASTTFAAAVANGISGQSYNLLEIKKKKSFLGIGIGTSTKYETQTQALNADVTRQIGLIIAALGESVIEAAKMIGLDVEAKLDTFRVEIGKISFKDMKPDEIEAALQAVFSKIGDQMAGFAVAGLAQYQKAGEGLFETLARLAKNYQTIDVTLQAMGKTFGSVGTESIAAREALIALFGTLEDFVDATTFYQQNFLTLDEQIAPIRTQVETMLASLGLSDVDTIAEFRAVVDAIDLTTEAGQSLFSSLMALAPAFHAVEQVEEQAVQKALDLARQKATMEIQLLEAQGKATEALAAKRALELALLDPTLRALQQSIYEAQDLAAAEAAAANALAAAKNNLSQAYERESGELQNTIDRMKSLGDSLRDVRREIYSTSGGTDDYAAALARLRQVGRLAGMGDEAAAGQLGGAINDFLPAALANAKTLQEYQRAQALAARYADSAISATDMAVTLASQQLDEMKAQVGQLIDLNETVLSVDEAMAQLVALQGGNIPAGATPGAGSQEQEREEREEERDDRDRRRDERQSAHESRVADLLAKLFDRNDRMERLWNNLSPDGLALTIRTDDDTPIRTESV